MWGQIIQQVAGLAGGYLGRKAEKAIPGLDGAGNAGAAIGQNLGSMASGTPMPGTGAAAGKFAKDYFKQIAPGASGYDLLGANSPAGPVSATEKRIEHEKEMQNNELKTREKVARIGATASTVGSALQFGPQGLSAAANALEGRPVAPYDTPVSFASKKLPFELKNLRAEEREKLSRIAINVQEARKRGSEAELKKHEADLAQFIAFNKASSGIAGKAAYDLARKLVSGGSAAAGRAVQRANTKRFLQDRKTPTFSDALERFFDRINSK